MRVKTLYLAGGINGLTDSQCNDWRAEVKQCLGELYHYKDPMIRDYRGKEDQCYRDIVAGDKADISESDYVLAMCERPSWGTGMEVYFANRLGLPVIVVCPGRVSPWLREHSITITPTLEAAIEFLRRLANGKAAAAD